MGFDTFMGNEYRKNKYFDSSLLPDNFSSIWVKVDRGALDIIAQRKGFSEHDLGAALYSKVHLDHDGITIQYLYGLKGIGTLVMNTWINLAKYLFCSSEKMVISGCIAEFSEPERSTAVNFYKQFGFLISNAPGHRSDLVFSANLSELKVVPNRKDEKKEYLLKPFMFSHEGSLLSNKIAYLKQKSPPE